VELTAEMTTLQSALDREKSEHKWTGDQLRESSNKLVCMERGHKAAGSQLQDLQVGFYGQ